MMKKLIRFTVIASLALVIVYFVAIGFVAIEVNRTNKIYDSVSIGEEKSRIEVEFSESFVLREAAAARYRFRFTDEEYSELVGQSAEFIELTERGAEIPSLLLVFDNSGRLIAKFLLDL